MTIPLLQQREIEANVIAPLYRAFAAEVGEPRAREIVAGVVRDLARQAGCTAAEALGGMAYRTSSKSSSSGRPAGHSN